MHIIDISTFRQFFFLFTPRRFFPSFLEGFLRYHVIQHHFIHILVIVIVGVEHISERLFSCLSS